MNSRLYLTSLVLGIACMTLSFTGCTVIGLCGGIMSDEHVPDEQIFRAVAADSIEMGSQLYLVRTNGATDTVIMAGVERVTPAGYQGRYMMWRSSHLDCVLIPSIGDSVLVVRDRLFGRTHHGMMVGWCRRGIVLSEGTGEEEKIQVNSIWKMSSDDQRALTPKRLEELLREATTPFVDDAAYVRLLSVTDTVVVAMQDIGSLRVPTDKHAWRNGLLGGLGVDAVIAILVLSLDWRI